MSPLSRPNTKYSVGSKAPTVLDCTPGRADRSPRPDLPLRRHEPPRSILSTQSSRRADHVKRAAPSKPSTTPSSGARSPAREAVPHARGRSRGVRALPTQGPVTNCLSLLFQQQRRGQNTSKVRRGRESESRAISDQRSAPHHTSCEQQNHREIAPRMQRSDAILSNTVCRYPRTP
jgi:hypothetical protein